VAEALDYARANGARVINFSFTSPSSTETLSNAFLAIQNADILLCAAAGNSGSDNNVAPIFPASYKMSNTVAVAAIDKTNGLWSASNYGSTSVHLGAPGVAIYSAYNSSDSGYEFNNGTSMATPMVSGAAALLRAKFPNESSAQIIQRILNSVDLIPSLAGRCKTGGRLNLRKALDTATLPLYAFTNAPFAWVETNGMTTHTFATSDGTIGPFALPFTFPFYGRGYTQFWAGANGLLGITNTGLTMGVNANIPTTNTPNAIYPYWDDLNPLAGGNVWRGAAGVAPNRKAVVSWVGVPHMTASGGPFTFQTILHESGHIAFQYQQVSMGSQAFTNGKSATIGVEEPSGLFGTRYALNGLPFIVTNNQALVFTPQVVNHPAPGLGIQSISGGQVQLTVSGEPRQPGAVLFSTNLTSWSMIYSNLLPASGLATFVESNSAPQRFYRALSGPFLP